MCGYLSGYLAQELRDSWAELSVPPQQQTTDASLLKDFLVLTLGALFPAGES